MTEYDINLIDKNFYKIPVFPVSEDEEGTQGLINRSLEIITGVNWPAIYDNSKINSQLFVNDDLYKELLDFTDAKLASMTSIDREVEAILAAENSTASPRRAQELKSWLVKYFKDQNRLNFPKFNSVVTLRLAYIIVISVLLKIFPEGIWCRSSQIEALKAANDSRIRLFLPSHKSHIDYIIVHVMCLRFAMPPPTVIAGENLNVRFFGNVLAKVGAVFIKRNWFNYTDILVDNYSNFFKFALKRGIDMELFIEGGRSRDGKLVVPKYGILKLICDQVRASGIPVAVHPMSIQYEKVYEFDSINNELIGKPKHKESMLNILKHGYKNLVAAKNHGKVYINFAAPIDVLESPASVSELGLDVMTAIDSVAHVTDVALFNTAIYLKHYEPNGAPANRVLIHEVIAEVDILCGLILETRTQENLLKLQKLDRAQKTRYLIQICQKFNRHCSIDKEYLVIKNDTDLIMYKNNLIHLFLNKSIIARLLLEFPLDEFDANLGKILTLFNSQFVCFHNFDVQKELRQLGVHELSEDGIRAQRDRLQWYSDKKFLDPFIESYLNFSRLLMQGQDFKNISQLVVRYTEAKNKAYSVVFLKKMNELRIYSRQKIDIQELQAQRNFLRSLNRQHGHLYKL